MMICMRSGIEPSLVGALVSNDLDFFNFNQLREWWWLPPSVNQPLAMYLVNSSKTKGLFTLNYPSGEVIVHTLLER